MKGILLICVTVSLSVSYAAPNIEDAQSRTLAYSNNNDGLGNYEFSFETSNGITRRESGRLVNVGQPAEHLKVEGSYSYLDTTGKLIVVNYTADENGYQTQEGQPLPDLQPFLPQVPPPAGAPPAVVASLLG